MAAGGLVTIVVIDVVGSTELHARAGDEAAERTIARHLAAVDRAVVDHDGSVVKHMGDRVLAIFRSSRRALACVAAVQRASSAQHDALSVRVGVTAGEVERDGDVHGMAVAIATRVAAMAGPGEILVDDQVRRVAGPDPTLRFAQRGALDLKDVPQTVEVVLLEWDVSLGEADRAPITEPPRVNIRVLGPITVDVDGHEVPLTSAPRLWSLLGWLALHPGLHRRARVAAVFWPDVSDATARNNLRQSLWDARRLLGPAAHVLAADRDHIGVLVRPEVWIDVVAFEDCVAANRLPDALALVGGDLLAGVDEDWVEEERERFNELLVDILGRLGADHEAHGDLESAIACARQAAGRSPYDEAAHRDLIRRLAFTGRRGEALAAYERLRRCLREDLDVEPSSETTLVATQVRDGTFASRSGQPTGALPHVAPAGTDERLVGRRRELVRLEKLMAEAASGRRQVVLVEGEAGMGKTRLAHEFAAAMADSGAVVLVGRATAAQLAGFQPWLEALRSYVLACPLDRLRRQLGAVAADVAPLVPELPRRLSSPAAATGEVDRYRMFEGVVHALHAMATDQPLLVVLEDLHWADQSSLELLRYVATARLDASLLLLLTSRMVEPGEQPELADTLAALASPRFTRMRLAGLDTSDVAALVAERAAECPPGDLVRTLHHLAAGNPFYILEVVRSLLETGALTIDDERWVWDLSRPEVVIPETLAQIIERRLARLGDNGRRVLDAASVIGDTFPAAVLIAALDAEFDVADALEPAVRRRFVTEVAPELYAFSHPLVREVLYGQLPMGRRASLHERIGVALEGGAHGTADVAALAHHFACATSQAAAERAVRYSIEAAEKSIRQGALVEAVAFFDQAIDHLPPTETERRRALHNRRAVVYSAAWNVVVEGVQARVTFADEAQANVSGTSAPSGGMSAGATSPDSG